MQATTWRLRNGAKRFENIWVLWVLAQFAVWSWTSKEVLPHYLQSGDVSVSSLATLLHSTCLLKWFKRFLFRFLLAGSMAPGGAVTWRMRAHEKSLGWGRKVLDLLLLWPFFVPWVDQWIETNQIAVIQSRLILFAHIKYIKTSLEQVVSFWLVIWLPKPLTLVGPTRPTWPTWLTWPTTRYLHLTAHICPLYIPCICHATETLSF